MATGSTRARTLLRHRYFAGMALATPCYLCFGDSDPCTSGHVSGYATCDDCHKSTGPEHRNCLPCFAAEFANSRDRKGFAPYFAILGDVDVRGRLHDPRSKKPCRNATVRVVFPNGLCLRAKTDSRGGFRVLIESSQSVSRRRPKVSLDIGPRPYRTKRDGFVLGFRLDLLTQPLTTKRASTTRK
jgi:hypothetical protein